MDADVKKMVIRLSFGPTCLAVMILVLAGKVELLDLARWLQF